MRCSRKIFLMKRNLSRNLNKMRELVLCVSGGRTFHADGREKAKVLKGDREQKNSRKGKEGKTKSTINERKGLEMKLRRYPVTRALESIWDFILTVVVLRGNGDATQGFGVGE